MKSAQILQLGVWVFLLFLNGCANNPRFREGMARLGTAMSRGATYPSGYYGQQSFSTYQAPAPVVIETRIDGTFEGWSGDTIWKMTNGQIWQQASFSFHYHFAFRPEVLIYPSPVGWKMKVEGVSAEAILVRRLR